MENATKALLIAAAVLVAILIISLGLAVYNKAANATSNSDLSSQEIQAQNEKFTRYNGKNKRGSEVNALLQTVLTNNLNATEDGTLVTVSGAVTLNPYSDGGKTNKTTSIPANSLADTSKLYKIVVNYDGPGGLVNTINVTEQ